MIKVKKVLIHVKIIIKEYKKSSVDSSPNKNYQSSSNNQKNPNNHAFEKTASDNEKTDDENISQTNTISVNNMSNTMPEHQNTLLTAENIFILLTIYFIGVFTGLIINIINLFL